MRHHRAMTLKPTPNSEPSTSTTLRALDEPECLELLGAAAVGRIGFVGVEGLEILPVNYRLGAGPRLFINTKPYGIVGQLAHRSAAVSFEVDYCGRDLRIGWSVLAQGRLSRLDEAGAAAYDELRLPPRHWPGPGAAVIAQFVPDTMTGRSLAPLARDDLSGSPDGLVQRPAST